MIATPLGQTGLGNAKQQRRSQGQTQSDLHQPWLSVLMPAGWNDGGSVTYVLNFHEIPPGVNSVN